jgi:predicted dehydrogenase
VSKIRIGFVGVGGMGQAAHLRNYVINPECEVVAIAEIRPKLAKKVAERYSIPRVYDGYEAMLAKEELDGIVAIQPFGLHVEIVPNLLKKGVPIITEKPIAETLENGRKILAAEQKANGKLFLAYHKRSDPATLRVLKQIEAWKQSGEVGKLRYIRVAMPPGDWSVQGMAHNVNTDEGYDAKWGGWDRYAGFVNYYIHQVNLIRLLLGEDYQVLYADPSGVTFGLRSASGVAGTLEMATHNTTIDWQEEAFVAFERGWIKLELPAPLAVDRPGRVTIFTDKGKEHEPTTTTPQLPWIHAMRSQAQQFVAAGQGKPTTLCRASDAVKDLEVATAYIALVEEAEKKHGLAQAKAKG